MKSLKKILALLVVVTSIIAFWLIPGINTAKDTVYVRRYEDTDIRPIKFVAGDTVGRKKKLQEETRRLLRGSKFYKTEQISSKSKLSKIKPSMFSRSIQFEEMVMLDSISIVKVTEQAKKNMQADTAALFVKQINNP
jgi:hypothetical protein